MELAARADVAEFANAAEAAIDTLANEDSALGFWLSHVPGVTYVQMPKMSWHNLGCWPGSSMYHHPHNGSIVVHRILNTASLEYAWSRLNGLCAPPPPPPSPPPLPPSSQLTTPSTGTRGGLQAVFAGQCRQTLCHVSTPCREARMIRRTNASGDGATHLAMLPQPLARMRMRMRIPCRGMGMWALHGHGV